MTALIEQVLRDAYAELVLGCKLDILVPRFTAELRRSPLHGLNVALSLVLVRYSSMPWPSCHYMVAVPKGRQSCQTFEACESEWC